MTITKTCPVVGCGNAFTVPAYRAGQVTCSRSCGQIQRRAMREASTGRPPVVHPRLRGQTCPACAQAFTPHKRGAAGQMCCSVRCAGIYRHRRDKEDSAQRVAAMQKARLEKRHAREQQLLNGCQSMVEAFRAGQRHERKRMEAMERYQRQRVA